jgi:Family of unknown function (DUF5681)
MNAPSDDYQVGYGRPPRETRWKKGQSGDPRKRKRKPREGATATIERLLLDPVSLTIDGESKRVSTLEAIVLLLLQQTMAGKLRAARILTKYRNFAHQNMDWALDLTFVESAYTRAVAKLAKDRANG